MSMELQSKSLPLLIACPNQQGVGENRDKFMLKVSKVSKEDTEMLQFLGKVLGMALRSKNPLSLDFPAFFWKPLVHIMKMLNLGGTGDHEDGLPRY